MAKQCQAPSSVLIVLMGSVGDVARALCLPKAIKSAFPDCRVSWLVEPRCVELVRMQPAVDTVIVFERDYPLRGLVRLRSELRAASFDVVLDLQRHFKSGFFSFLTGAPRRLGFKPADSKEFNWLFNTESIELDGSTPSKLEHYLAFLRKLGIPGPRVPVWELSVPSAEARILSMIRQAGDRYIVVVMGSTWPSKDWLPQGYAQLVAALLDRGLGVVLVGDGRQARISRELVARLRNERLVSAAGETSLTELCQLLSAGLAAVGPDSGPGHLAAALGKKYVSLFGPTCPERTAPWGSESLALRARLGCMPCYRRRCPGLDRLCMRLINPEDVVAQTLDSVDRL